MAAHHRMMAAVVPGLTTVAGLYAEMHRLAPPSGREAHTPTGSVWHVSVLLAEAVAA